MQAVILAGGGGTRLRNLADRAPKPMLPFFDKPVMEHTVRLLKKHGVDEILIALSYRAKEVMDHFGDGAKWRVKIGYSLEEKPLGSAGAIKRLQPLLRETFLVISGDTITDFNLSAALEFHRRSSAMATMLLSEAEEPSDYGVVLAGPSGLVSKYLEKPRPEDVFSKTVSTGIYVMEPDILSQIPYESPCEFGLDVFPRMLSNRDPLYGCELPGYWCDVGNPVHYRNAHFDALTGRLDVEIGGKQVDADVHVARGAEIHKAAHLTPPLYVGPGAEIRRNASIGNVSVVGAGALIDEAAVVAHSVIGDGAFIGRAAKVSNCLLSSGYHVEDNQFANDLLVVEEGEFAAEEEYAVV